MKELEATAADGAWREQILVWARRQKSCVSRACWVTSAGLPFLPSFLTSVARLLPWTGEMRAVGRPKCLGILVGSCQWHDYHSLTSLHFSRPPILHLWVRRSLNWVRRQAGERDWNNRDDASWLFQLHTYQLSPWGLIRVTWEDSLTLPAGGT